MPDTFVNNSVNLNDPAPNFELITPSDSTDMATVPRFLIVGASGSIKMTDRRGTTIVIQVQAGVVPLRPSRVWATGTTATSLVACW